MRGRGGGRGESLWSDLSKPPQRDVEVVMAPLDVLVEVDLGGVGELAHTAGELPSLGPV